MFYRGKREASTDVCSPLNHMPIPNLLSRRPANKYGSSETVCDLSLAPSWYSTANYTIPTVAQTLSSCGALFPVWMNDHVPGVGEETDALMCTVGFASSCSESFHVRVKNCGTRVVYHLRALTKWHAAYCFDCELGYQEEKKGDSNLTSEELRSLQYLKDLIRQEAGENRPTNDDEYQEEMEGDYYIDGDD